ncbi:MAG: hypothetical protein EXS16_15145 [Gemmataceae bacterium]|nr:hypothetical protein [Gemmataceae bacterium]
MSSVLTNLMTAEEFYDWVHRPENRNGRFELDRGKVVDLDAPCEGIAPGIVCATTAYVLVGYTRATKTGYVTIDDQGVTLERESGLVRGADIALYVQMPMPNSVDRTSPEPRLMLAVDVWRPSDRSGMMQRRSNAFLDRGAAMVWLLDPVDRSLVVSLPNQMPIVLEGDEVVTGFGVLPDFSCKAAEFFELA